MAKLDIKEVKGGRVDSRADDDDPRPQPVPGQRAAAPEPRPRPFGGMAPARKDPGLARPLPPPPAAAAQAPPTGSGNLTSGDTFGIVGTAVADTFQVESVVAHGGFAVVYRAKHLKFAAPVALKCLKIPSNLTQAERNDFLDRFQKEGEVMFRLSSYITEIVRPLQIDSFKHTDGRLVPFIALEWLEGETLKDVIVNRLAAGKPPLSLAQAVTFLTPVARGLARAHRLPSPEGTLCILHCDLKPDNIFVTTLGGVESLRIFDFGISKVRHAATRQVGGATTDSSASMFTPAYAAPEQWTPDRLGQAGPWTDVFSLALTLAELSTQKPAIDGAPTAMLAQCINEKSRPTPRKLGLAVPDRIEAIFTRALAVDPRVRYQAISKFWGDLEEALGLPVVVGESARSPSLASMSLDEGARAAPAPAPPPASAHAGASSPMFAGELDLPLSPAAAPPSSGPAAAPARSAPPSPGAGLPDFSLPVPSQAVAAAPDPLSFDLDAAVAAPRAPAPAQAEAAPMDFGASLDLAAEPARPAPAAATPNPHMQGPAGAMLRQSQSGVPVVRPSAAGMPAVNPHAIPTPPNSYPGMMQQPGMPGVPDPNMEGAPISVGGRERLQQAAAKAGHVASQVASVAAVTAAKTAKTIATRALEVDERHRIQLDQPATWIKPMMGPIVAFCVAVLISIVVVFVNKATGSNVSVVWISLPLMLASIGFFVYRWMKITKE